LRKYLGREGDDADDGVVNEDEVAPGAENGSAENVTTSLDADGVAREPDSSVGGGED
jgi:hypothetical protein